ncbi:MAG: methyltetrahydrofolate cobalamin methyltransferase [Desulfobacteraceae bacterium]|nr:methyltetrahydrofolate cobalamin methyltransferase [Desulfobacteraceae bacterium]
MLIVGENINTSRKRIAEAVEKQDAQFIVQAAKNQADAGADFIDVNAGTFVNRETEYLCWLVKTVQDAVDLPLCLDSPNPEALSEAVKHHRGEPMINSISLEEDRFQGLLPVITSQPCKVVALCMAQTSMPTTTDERVAVAAELIEKLTNAGVALEDIYVDPLVQPVSVDVNMGNAVLEAIQRIMETFPGVHTICGLSNISYGLPLRKLVNRNFLALATARGLSAAILDPTDKRLIATLLSTRMILGKDEYCGDFIDAYQDGIISKD